MPPKAVPRNRKSQNLSQDYIPIYDIISDKDRQEVNRDLSRKLGAMVKNDVQSLEKSFIIFAMKVCGLDQCIEKINWRDHIQSLSDLLEQMCEQNQKTTLKSEFLLINFKSKFHKEFLSRIRQLLQVAINDELSIMEQTQFMKKVYQTLLVISKSKMRNIRHSSVLMSELIMKRSKVYYQELINSKATRKASKLLSLIDEGYLQQIIRPRLKDIDIKIREKAFEITNQILLSFPHQLLNVKKLTETYTQILIENKTKITQLCLKSITYLFQSNKQKIGLTATRNLSSYAAQIIKPIQDLVLLPNRNSCLAMDVLLAIHNFNHTLNSLKPKIIAKVFQIHGFQNYHQGLRKVVSIFLKSLLTFETKDDLKEHRSLLQIEIIHLLCSINSSKLMSTILNQFFNLYENLFDFDEMFLLLFTEYYNQNSSDVELQEKQLNVVCTMICQFNLYLRNSKETHERQKQQQSFNKNVLTNCKQIFYEKIVKHPTICNLYLRLFSRLFTPISGSIQDYMSFVEEKILNFVREQNFFTIAGDSLVLMQQILEQCTSICSLIVKDSGRLEPLMKSYGLNDLMRKQKLDDVDILKVSSLLSKFNIESLTQEKMVKKVLMNYSSTQQKIVKLETLSYLYKCHQYMFTSLFNEPSLQKHEQYMIIRKVFIEFGIHMILGSASQNTMIKLAAFNVICRTFRLICNTRIADIHGIFYEPSNDQMQMLYDFMGEYIHFNEQQSMNETTMMMAAISLENQQIREQILQNLFALFSQSLKLSLNKLSIKFLAKFLLSKSPIFQSSTKYLDNFLNELIKSEILNQNSNKFIYWRLFQELILEVGLQSEDEVSLIVAKLIDVYYKFRKGQSQTKVLLSNKLMLFLADTMDKYVNNQNFRGLLVIKAILMKTMRKFPKQTLQRLLIFFSEKVKDVEDKNVKSLKQYLKKISKGGKKEKKNRDSRDSSGQSDKEDEKDENQEKESQQQQDKQNEDMENGSSKLNRVTRSKTKRKTN